MTLNKDCMFGGFFGSFCFIMVTGMIWAGCSEEKKANYDKGFREGKEEGEKTTAKKYESLYQDPASYPKGSCGEQATQCYFQEHGLPSIDYRQDDYRSKLQFFLLCEKKSKVEIK